MEDIEQTAITIRNAIRDLPVRYEENERKIKRLENERNDLEHYIELKKFNAAEGYKIASDLQRVLQERRELKDENEQLEHLYPSLKGLKNQLSQFDKAIGDIRKSKSYVDKRTYRCRVRKDLQKVINGR